MIKLGYKSAKEISRWLELDTNPELFIIKGMILEVDSSFSMELLTITIYLALELEVGEYRPSPLIIKSAAVEED